MTGILDIPTLYAPSEATTIAEKLNRAELDGWTYRVEHNLPARYATINVYDDEGEFVGYI